MSKDTIAPSVIDEAVRNSEAAPGRLGKLSFRALVIEPSNDTFIQFARYTIVGGVALLADFFTLFSLTHFAAIYYLISAGFAFLVGLGVNYGLSAAWVFAHHTLRNRSLEFTIFAAVGVAGLGLNELGMWLLTSHFGFHYLWAKLITASVVYFWNFGARKAALFR